MTNENVNEATGEVYEGEYEAPTSVALERRPSSALAETSATAQAAMAEAQVKAKFAIARAMPRDELNALVKLKRECARPEFAEVARYTRPVGKEKNDAGKWVDVLAEGPSIRFAEAAARYMGNIDSGAVTVFDDREKRILRIFATDLETNTSFSDDLTIAKTLERRQLKRGQQALSQRVNSYGDQVFIVRAEDSEIVVKQAAEVSKKLRVLLLRLVPGWIIDACMTLVLETQAKGDAENPAAARMRLAEAFAAYGVAPPELAAFLGHPLDGASPAELAKLRAVYQTIKDGIASWRDIASAEGASAEARAADPKMKAAQAAVEKTIAEQRKKAEAVQKAKPGAAPPAEPAQPAQPAQQAPAKPAEQPAPTGRQPGEEG